MTPRPVEWLYRKLGAKYPFVYLAIELQTAFLIAIGAIGLVTFYYEGAADEFLTLTAITCGLTAVALGIVLYRVNRFVDPIRSWIAGNRGPEATAEAWRETLHLPLKLIRRDWAVPIVLVALPASVATILLLGLQWLAFFPLFFGAMLALSYSGVLHYLAIELGMRPIIVDMNRSLHEPMRLGVRAMPLRVKLLGALPLINVMTGVTVAALTSDGGGASSLGIDVMIALFVAFTISFELTLLLTRSITEPIDDLEEAIDRIRRGRYEEHVPVTRSDEIGELQTAFNQMVDGLAERERLRSAFGTYLDEEVADYIISQGFDPSGREVEVSLLFCDAQDFTHAAADSDATEIVSRLNELFETVVPIVRRHNGHVDQFVGDGLLAVFGAPNWMEDHADRAVQCGVEIARTVNSRRPGGFKVGVGVNSGLVVAGSIGGAGRLSFSVIGDAVNLASRVESHTRELGDPVLITEATRSLLSETIEVKGRGLQQLKGYENEVELYAPVVPVAVTPGAGGEEISDSLAAPEAIGLGKPGRTTLPE